MNKKQLILDILAFELLLLVPLIGMFLSENMNWSLIDFAVAAVLLAGVGVAYRLIAEGLKSRPRRVVLGLVIAILMMLIWVELAVGVLGSPIAGN